MWAGRDMDRGGPVEACMKLAIYLAHPGRA
jgi:hypothetical protein